MSTFNGQIKECPGISIDRFDGENINNSTFFLSHNHRDHTVGLFSDQFIYRLHSNKEIKLYCSQVTKDLLLVDALLQKYVKKCPGLSKSIIGLPTEEPKKLFLIDPDTGQEKEEITVTLLPAGHCPGSVMFLLEGTEGIVLYTGDFRLTQEDYKSMHHLRHGNSVKDIKSMHVDTTFCVPEIKVLPSRKESAEQVIDIIKKWICRGPEYVVHISHKADLGYEQLYRDVAIHFSTKVHVAHEKFEEYKKVGDMQTFTTSDPGETQIHGCWGFKNKKKTTEEKHHTLPCGYSNASSKKLQVCTIKVSAMHFVNKVIPNTKVEKINDYFYRVLYSFHSSYLEIRDFVTYIKPQSVFPNVVPVDHTRQQIQNRLNRFLEVARANDKPRASQEYRPLGEMKVKKKKGKRKLNNSQHSDDLDFAECTPEKKKTKNSVKEFESKPVLCYTRSKKNENGSQNIPSKSEKTEFPLLFGGNTDSEEEENNEDCKKYRPEEVSATEKEKQEFPLLFGGGSYSDDDEHDEEIKCEDHKKEGDVNEEDKVNDEKNDLIEDDFNEEAEEEPYDESDFNPSQSLFSEDDLLPEDKELVQGLTPQNLGSESDSDSVVHEGEYLHEEESQDSDVVDADDKIQCDEPSQSSTVEYNLASFESSDEQGAKTLTKSQYSTPVASCSSVFHNKSTHQISSNLSAGPNCNTNENDKDFEEKDLENFKKEDVEHDDSFCVLLSQENNKFGDIKQINNIKKEQGKNVKNKSNKSSSNRKNRKDLSLKSDDDNADLEESVEIVSVIEGNSSDSVEMEQVFYRSSRERYISERLDDYQKAGKSEKGDTPEEIQRPSVVRYPTSGFYSSVTIDKTHAAQGYHNMISNIEKILKSPSKGSDESDDCDIVVLDKKRAIDLSRRKRIPKKPECTKSRPDSDSDEDDINFKDNFDSEFNSAQRKPSSGSESDDIIGNDEVEVTVKNSDIDSICIDLTNDDEMGETSRGSKCSSNEVWTDTDIVSSAVESDGDVQHDPSKAVAKDKHKKLRKRKSQNDSYLSGSSDSDCEGYSSDDWYVDLHEIKSVSDGRNAMKLLKTNCKSKSVKSSEKTLPQEVIVLDDSSNGSIAQDRSTQTPLQDVLLGPSPAKITKFGKSAKTEKISKKQNNNEVAFLSNNIAVESTAEKLLDTKCSTISSNIHSITDVQSNKSKMKVSESLPEESCKKETAIKSSKKKIKVVHVEPCKAIDNVRTANSGDSLCRNGSSKDNGKSSPVKIEDFQNNKDILSRESHTPGNSNDNICLSSVSPVLQM